MSNLKSTQIEASNPSNVVGGWGQAIIDAYEMIGAAKARMRELKKTITLLEELRDNDVPFPGLSGQTADFLGKRDFLGKAGGLNTSYTSVYLLHSRFRRNT